METTREGGIRNKWYKGWDLLQSYLSTPIRDKWNRQLEFMLTCLGYCIGFGNIWRFPYVVHKNGGGAFFLPYILILIILALPIFYMETLLGQFSGCNPISVYSFAPACKGIGFSSLMVCLYCSMYYIMFMVYASKYFFQSFAYELPWARCKPEWGADANCLDRLNANKNVTWKTNLSPPTEQYWQIAILHLKDHTGKRYSIENLGSIQWDLFGLLLLSCIIQYLYLFRGIKLSGKLVYFTATFPFVVLITLLLYALTLDGAVDGLEYLFFPDWSLARSCNAIFFSTGIAYGCLILYSSFNDFQYPVRLISIAVVFLDLFASFCSSMTVFSILGYLAKRLNNVDITKVVEQGPGLIFVVMPEAISTMPVAQLWSCLYFLMLYTVGIASQASMVDTVITTSYEEIPKLKKHKGKVRIFACLCLFLLSIPCTMNGGIHFVKFLDNFSTEITLTTIALCELLSVMFVYGYRKFFCDVHFMCGHRVNLYWRVCWLGIIPVLLIILLGLGLFNSTSCEHLSIQMCIIGWIIALSCLISIPAFALYSMFIITPKWRTAYMPEPQWGPRDMVNKLLYLEWQKEKGQTFDEETTTNLDSLLAEVTPEMETVEAVVKNRLDEKRFSIFHRFGPSFKKGEIDVLDSNM
uniref:Transporter n=1 Tax=Strigamia maritima TaxID=126957 RepID=T1IMJ8_STRMM